MKYSLLVKQLLDKVTLENKSKYEQALTALPDLDLPDDFEAVANALHSLHTEDSAKSNKTLAEYHTGKFKKNTTQNWQSRLQAMGFEEPDILEILAKPFENQWEAAMAIERMKLQKQHTMSETELVRAEKEKAKQEKDRADRLQANSLERENYWKNKIESDKLEFHLRNSIAGLEIAPGLPKEKAGELIFNDTVARLAGMNAKITYGPQGLRLVQGDDTALDYYDERNNIVTVNRLIEEIRTGLNLTPTTNVKNTNSGNIFKPFQSRNGSNAGDGNKQQAIPGNYQKVKELTSRLLSPQ